MNVECAIFVRRRSTPDLAGAARRRHAARIMQDMSNGRNNAAT